MSVHDVTECIVMTPQVYNAYMLSRFNENNAPNKYVVKPLSLFAYNVEKATTYLFDSFEEAKAFAFSFEVPVRFL